MLNRDQIRLAIRSGDIYIDPYDESLLEQAKYGLHLEDQLLVPKPNQLVDLRNTEKDEQGCVLKPQ